MIGGELKKAQHRLYSRNATARCCKVKKRATFVVRSEHPIEGVWARRIGNSVGHNPKEAAQTSPSTPRCGQVKCVQTEPIAVENHRCGGGRSFEKKGVDDGQVARVVGDGEEEGRVFLLVHVTDDLRRRAVTDEELADLHVPFFASEHQGRVPRGVLAAEKEWDSCTLGFGYNLVRDKPLEYAQVVTCRRHVSQFEARFVSVLPEQVEQASFFAVLFAGWLSVLACPTLLPTKLGPEPRVVSKRCFAGLLECSQIASIDVSEDGGDSQTVLLSGWLAHPAARM